MSFPFSAAAAEPPHPAPGPSIAVQPGDSWTSIRNRLFPVDALKTANPGLDPEILHPGDVVRAPYAPVSELERERAARQAVEQQLIETKHHLAVIDEDRAALELRRHEVNRAERRLASLRALVIGLALVAIILVALLGAVVKATRAARRSAADVTSRYGALQSHYEELRQSLHEIDVRLQQRVVTLLHLHGGKVVSDAELQSSMGHVLDLAHELKRKQGPR